MVKRYYVHVNTNELAEVLRSHVKRGNKQMIEFVWAKYIPEGPYEFATGKPIRMYVGEFKKLFRKLDPEMASVLFDGREEV